MKIDARFLVRLYPRKWRERYGGELVELLGQTGFGWKQTGDVIVAASRERLRAATHGVLSPAVSHQTARLAGFYSLSWLSVWLLQWMLPPAPRIDAISVLSLSDHRRLLTTFLISALVSRIVDNWALPDAEVIQPPKSTAQAIGLLSVTITAVIVYVAAPAIAVSAPVAFAAVYSGQMFGRLNGALAALEHAGPGREPRPTSITTLGLSA